MSTPDLFTLYNPQTDGNQQEEKEQKKFGEKYIQLSKKLEAINRELNKFEDTYNSRIQKRKALEQFLNRISVAEDDVKKITEPIKKIEESIKHVEGFHDSIDAINETIQLLKYIISEKSSALAKHDQKSQDEQGLQKSLLQKRVEESRVNQLSQTSPSTPSATSPASSTPGTPSRLVVPSESTVIQALSNALKDTETPTVSKTPPKRDSLALGLPLGTAIGGTKKRKFIQRRSRKISRKK